MLAADEDLRNRGTAARRRPYLGSADEDLRNRGTAAGAPDHLDAPRRLLDNINFSKGNAFAFQQGAGTHAVGAERRRVQLDLNHSHRASSLVHTPVRSARARVSTPMDTAPARFSTRAHSATVAPVVITSSMITTCLPATLRRARIAKAPWTLRSRAAGPR